MSGRGQSRRYVHERLSSPATSIRLLTLDVENDKHFLAGSLEIFDLDKNSDYIAASYEWGEIEPGVDFVIDGKPFPVRHNLWLLLSEIKNRINRGALSRKVRIWIDAICINQQDQNERNQQVSVMGQIYKSATCVFAWLGLPEGWEPSITFDFIRARPWDTQNRRTHSEVNGNQKFFPRYSYPQLWEMVLRMCTCRYWSRRWVIQELLLATDVTIICGAYDLAWYFLIRLLDGLHWVHWARVSENNDTIERLQATIPMIMSRYTAAGSEAFKAIYQPNDHSLMDLMTDFQGTDCEVTHDKIYSLVSLTRERADFSIDYGCAPEALVGSLLIRMGWREPLEVRTILTDLGFGNAIPLSFGGPKAGSPSQICSVLSMTATRRIAGCISLDLISEYNYNNSPELKYITALLSKVGGCISLASLRTEGARHKLSHEIKSSSNHYTSSSPELSKLAACEDGSLALVCMSARSNDYICQFERSTELIVRPERENSTGAGTASVIGTAKSVIERERTQKVLEELKLIPLIHVQEVLTSKFNFKKPKLELLACCEEAILALEAVLGASLPYVDEVPEIRKRRLKTRSGQQYNYVKSSGKVIGLNQDGVPHLMNMSYFVFPPSSLPAEPRVASMNISQALTHLHGGSNKGISSTAETTKEGLRKSHADSRLEQSLRQSVETGYRDLKSFLTSDSHKHEVPTVHDAKRPGMHVRAPGPEYASQSRHCLRQFTIFLDCAMIDRGDGVDFVRETAKGDISALDRLETKLDKAYARLKHTAESKANVREIGDLSRQEWLSDFHQADYFMLRQSSLDRRNYNDWIYQSLETRTGLKPYHLFTGSQPAPGAPQGLYIEEDHHSQVAFPDNPSIKNKERAAYPLADAYYALQRGFVQRSNGNFREELTIRTDLGPVSDLWVWLPRPPAPSILQATQALLRSRSVISPLHPVVLKAEFEVGDLIEFSRKLPAKEAEGAPIPSRD